MMGKVGKVIIGSGSTYNIISEEAASKLNMKIIPHSNPYKVTWLNNGKHVHVSEQAWVEFSIGRYKDKVLIWHSTYGCMSPSSRKSMEV